jgi:hypothetical protein
MSTNFTEWNNPDMGLDQGTSSVNPGPPTNAQLLPRLQILMSYSNANIRDTWVSMGQLEVNDSTRTYTRYSVFRVVQPTPVTPLNGYILFCDADYLVLPSFQWENMVVASTTGQIMDKTTLIIDPHFNVVLTQAQFQAIVPSYDATFVPFTEATANDLVAISDVDLNMLLSDIGVPFINIPELEFTRDQIINTMIYPALRIYYKWFPIIVMGRYPLADTNFNIPIPSYAFTAQRAYINPGYPISNIQGNPLIRYFDEVLMSISPRGAFSTPNLNSSRRQGFVDTQSYSTYILERAARQGIINYGTRTRVRIYIQQGMVIGYTTKRGVLEIEWGMMSNQWTDIPFNRQDEVRDLAKAYVLRAFAMLRMQSKSDIPGTINYQEFLTRADKLEERTIELWQSAAKPAVIRV